EDRPAHPRETVDLPRRPHLPGDALGGRPRGAQARKLLHQDRGGLQLAQLAETLGAGGDVALHLRLFRGFELPVVVPGELLFVERAVHFTPMTQAVTSKFQYTISISISIPGGPGGAGTGPSPSESA